MGPTNNGFGSFGNGDISSGGGGDIILSPTKASGQRKKSWKWVIAVLVVLIVIGGGITAVSLLPKGNNDHSGLMKKFNIYANYLLYGVEDDGSAIEDFNASDTFAIDEKYEDAEYLSKLLEYENQFSSAYAGEREGAEKDAEDDGVEEDMEEETERGEGSLSEVSFSGINERIEFLILYNELESIDAETLYNRYEEFGKDDAVAYVESFYSLSVTEDGEEVQKKEDDSESEEVNYLINLAKEYKKEILLAEIDFWSTDEIPEELNIANQALNDLVYGSISFLKDQCKLTYELMKEDNEA